MISLMIASVGMLGLANMTILAGHSNGVGRRYSQAVAIAHDLMQQIELWEYSDPRLVDSNPDNNEKLRPPRLVATVGDVNVTQTSAELDDADKADFIDGSNTSGVATSTSLLDSGSYTGIPRSALPPGFQRMWSVRDIDTDGDGVVNFKAIALTVRWQDEINKELWRYATFFTAKLNPAALAL